jgi:hypothetical protein
MRGKRKESKVQKILKMKAQEIKTRKRHTKGKEKKKQKS